MDSWRPVIIGAVVLLVVGLLVLAVRGHRRMQADARELDATVVEQYCRLVASEHFAEAFERSVTAAYRQRLSLEQFVDAHRRLRAELGGPLQGRELLIIQSSRNLFSSERTFNLRYELRYPTGTRARVVVLSDAEGAFRVDGTFVEFGSDDSLSFEVW
ncbi:MAG: hypothetical protein JNJ54_14405 [Myxococcaceae bacterium]|nr:hypothetical protein [Myxococcaceae bacterium]